MRVIQNILLAVGAPALGLVLCGVGLAYVAASVFRPNNDSVPFAIPSFVCSVSCGSLFGAIVGFVGALRSIARGRTEPWKPLTWVGMAVGVAVGLALRIVGVLGHSVLGWHIALGWTVIVVIALATLGGLLGTLATELLEHQRRAAPKHPTRKRAAKSRTS